MQDSDSEGNKSVPSLTCSSSFAALAAARAASVSSNATRRLPTWGGNRARHAHHAHHAQVALGASGNQKQANLLHKQTFIQQGLLIHPKRTSVSAVVARASAAASLL